MITRAEDVRFSDPMDIARLWAALRRSYRGHRQCVWRCRLCGSSSIREPGVTVQDHLRTCPGVADPEYAIRESKRRHPSNWKRSEAGR